MLPKLPEKTRQASQLEWQVSVESNIQKEEFSYAYLQAIASAAGCAFLRTTTPLDQVGVDAIITGVGARGSRGFPQLYVQVKCTSRDLLDEDSVRYPLRVKNYEELRNERQYPPLILVVVLVPENVDDWLSQSSEELCLHHGGYWLSLAGEPATPNQETLTVSLPRKNLLTVKAMTCIMQRISRGENL